MQLLRSILASFKIQRWYFEQGREEIAQENLVIMKIAGSVGALAAGFFFLIAPLAIPSWSITIEYIFSLPILASAFLFSWLYSRGKHRSTRVVEAASAIFYGLLLADFIALSVFPYPNTPQIFISLCFMFMPALMIQRPLVLLGLMAGAEGIFLALAAQYKTTFALENDIFNTAAALLFSLIIMATTNRLRCRNFSARVKLEKLSQTDVLTGLLNKAAFEQACTICLEEAGSVYTLLVLDLDGFKQINDNYGHPFGDALLAQVGQVLRGAFRQSDLIGRIGGDEFAALLHGVSEPSLLAARYSRLRQSLDAIVLDEQALHISCCIGAATSSGSPCTYIDLFRQADQALYQAKRQAHTEQPGKA